MCSESIHLDFKEHNGTSAVPEINYKILTTQSAYLNVSLSVVNSLQLHRLQPPRLLCPWNSPGLNNGVGSLFLLQGSSHPRDSLPAEPPAKPKNTGVVSLQFLQQIFQLRNRTRVSCIASRFFTQISRGYIINRHSIQKKRTSKCGGFPLWIFRKL